MFTTDITKMDLLFFIVVFLAIAIIAFVVYSHHLKKIKDDGEKK